MILLIKLFLQFHLVQPVLPIFDRILCICKPTLECDEHLPWFWVQLLFLKALDHPNGWVRVWAAEKVFSVDTALLITDYSVGFRHLVIFLISFISIHVTFIFSNKFLLACFQFYMTYQMIFAWLGFNCT